MGEHLVRLADTVCRVVTGSRQVRLGRAGCVAASFLAIAVGACTRPRPDAAAVDSIVTSATVAAVPTLPTPAVADSATATGAPPAASPSSVAVSSSSTIPDGLEPVPARIDDISMTYVPPDVLVPSNHESLNDGNNPINGARGGPRPAEDVDCEDDPDSACLVHVLDLLGFDVTSGSASELDRRIRRAIAVVQLDAGLDMTGVADDALFEYLGIRIPDDSEHRPDEIRVIGTSGQGRPITAMRYGSGTRAVLVVGETHGDEEAGLRVLLRARQQALPDDVTLWMIPTMNPDGGIADSRFQANGANLNRDAPSEPEQRAVFDFALEVEPSLTVWYHQNYGWVGGSGASSAPARQYQELTGLGTLRRSGDCAKGFMWCPIDEALNSSSILVELPDVVTPADVQIHALALISVATDDDF
jgi:hypothetical protein